MIIVDGSHPLLVWARGHEVANERPPPEPGFRRGDDVTFYTTARGCTYVVLNVTGRPCLIPCDHTPECDEVEVDTPSLCALAEAADQIDAELEDGWYALRFVLFFREGSSTRLVYPTEHGFRAITIPEVPVGAVWVDVVPEDAVRCVSSPRAPVSGGDHG